jgi:flagellar protein FlgJ
MTTTPITNGIAAPNAAAPSTTSPEIAKLKKAAHAFEAVFLRQMIGSMRSAGLGDGIFDSEATQQFQEMSDAKTADVMAEKGAFGIADMLVKQYGARLAATVAPAAAGEQPPISAAADGKLSK